MDTLLLVVCLGFIIGLTIFAVSFRYRAKWYVSLRNEYGIVSPKSGTHSRLLVPGRHLINPFTEEIVFRIPKGRQTTRGTSKLLRTHGGVLVTIAWSAEYSLDSFLISVQKEPHRYEHIQLNTLPNRIISEIDRELRHLIGRKSFEDLYTISATQELEIALRHSISEGLFTQGFENLSLFHITITQITFPDRLEKEFDSSATRIMWTRNFIDRTQILAGEEFFASGKKYSPSTPTSLGPKLIGLINLLDECYDEGEAIELCLQMDVKYENLPASGKRNKLRELVVFLQRRQRIAILLEIIKNNRPNRIADIDSLEINEF